MCITCILFIYSHAIYSLCICGHIMCITCSLSKYSHALYNLFSAYTTDMRIPLSYLLLFIHLHDQSCPLSTYGCLALYFPIYGFCRIITALYLWLYSPWYVYIWLGPISDGYTSWHTYMYDHFQFDFHQARICMITLEVWFRFSSYMTMSPFYFNPIHVYIWLCLHPISVIL